MDVVTLTEATKRAIDEAYRWPEFPDRGEHKPLSLRVIVYEGITDEKIRDRIINYNNDDSRKWLSKLIVWATCNGKSVEILNVRDDE